MTADPARLAAFVAGLPDGQRHKGFFWAVMTAVANDAPVGPIVAAAEKAGLEKEYVDRTVREANREHGQT